MAGRGAPPEKMMGHAGAIIMGRSGTAQGKIETFQAAGVMVTERPSDVAKMLAQEFKEKNISAGRQSESDLPSYGRSLMTLCRVPVPPY